MITAALVLASRYLARKTRATMVFVRTLGIGDGVEVVIDTRDLECLSLTTTETGDPPGETRGLAYSHFAVPPRPGAEAGLPSRNRLM